jgi:hypothetical protein
MMKLLPPLLFTLAALASAAKPDWPTGPRTTPPTVSNVMPKGAPRGQTVKVVLQGFNLADASSIYFGQPGVTGRITGTKPLPDLPENRLGTNGTASTVDLGPLPPRNELTLELNIAADAKVGPVDFRLQTPLGTTPTARFLVGPSFPETKDQAPLVMLPTVLTGAIGKAGNVDSFRFQVDAPGELLFNNLAAMSDSKLRPVISIRNAANKVLREASEAVFSHTFEAPGEYRIRISDFEESGSAGHFYRIAIARPAEGAELRRARMKMPASPDPTIAATGVNLSPATAQPVSMPVAIDGRLTSPAQYFRFHAAKDDKLILDVNARRSGSPLDSLIEVLDANGQPIERATVRAVFETASALRDHDSNTRGIRLASFTGFQPGDFVMMGGEIVRIETLPPNPDSDYNMEAINGERLAWLDTTPEAHAMDSPVYKVQIAPPGTKFAPNGLPIAHLTYRNDDGGPGYGKDSRLHFTAPADGDYIVRIQDVRGLTGEDFTYRVSIRRPKPAYTLSVSPRNPNVPVGGRIPLTVTAMRLDDFDGPIDVTVKDLPPGLHATRATILPGDTRTTLLLSADDNAKLEAAVPLVVADAQGLRADPNDKLKLISVIPKSDVQMAADTREVVLQAGGTAEVAVSIQRNNGFAGRVPVEVRNLPPGVEVIDTGLNGVLINENETSRTFTLRLLPTAQPHTQPIYASASVETRAGGQQNTFATEAITLKILPAKAAAR